MKPQVRRMPARKEPIRLSVTSKEPLQMWSDPPPPSLMEIILFLAYREYEMREYHARLERSHAIVRAEAEENRRLREEERLARWNAPLSPGAMMRMELIQNQMKELEFPNLKNGSNKQIAWAEELRAKAWEEHGETIRPLMHIAEATYWMAKRFDLRDAEPLSELLQRNEDYALEHDPDQEQDAEIVWDY